VKPPLPRWDRFDHALEVDIRRWIKAWNEEPRPFVWTKTAGEILQSLSKYMSKIFGGGY
jgi:hypothetical protein